MFNKHKKQMPKQHGYSMVGAMIAAGLLALLLSSNLNLLSFISSSSSKSVNDELLNQMTRISEVFSSQVNRGGGSLSPEGDAKGIQLCRLNQQGTQCTAYSNQSTNYCLTLPTQVGNGALASIEVRGFRLLNGTLQKRHLSNVNMATFPLVGFCTGDEHWENLHNPDDFTVSELKLCKFEANNLTQITANYRNQCKSILSADFQSGAFWIALFTAKTAHATANVLTQTRVIQLFNETRITTL